jgi:hypothetical protein
MRALLLTGALLAFLMASACSRQIDVPTEDSGTQTDQAPFRTVESDSAEGSHDLARDQTTAANVLPFHESQDLPAGTLLTIRLNAPIRVSKSEFEGSLEEALTLHGKTVLPRGSLVSGRVESASATNVKPDRAYVRLALTCLRISGADVPVRTASLFARQYSPDRYSPSEVRVEQGRRLTFRLTEPLYAATQTAKVTPK